MRVKRYFAPFNHIISYKYYYQNNIKRQYKKCVQKQKVSVAVSH